MTATIVSKNDNWILTIPKQLLSDDCIKRLIERIEFFNLLAESELSRGRMHRIYQKKSKKGGGKKIVIGFSPKRKTDEYHS